MFILNPPYTLHDQLAEVLPYLTDVLGQYDGAHYLLEQKAD
jgi:23S rRNA (adenine2030-N6)-methyltransferase